MKFFAKRPSDSNVICRSKALSNFGIEKNSWSKNALRICICSELLAKSFIRKYAIFQNFTFARAELNDKITCKYHTVMLISRGFSLHDDRWRLDLTLGHEGRDPKTLSFVFSSDIVWADYRLILYSKTKQDDQYKNSGTIFCNSPLRTTEYEDQCSTSHRFCYCVLYFSIKYVTFMTLFYLINTRTSAFEEIRVRIFTGFFSYYFHCINTCTHHIWHL